MAAVLRPLEGVTLEAEVEHGRCARDVELRGDAGGFGDGLQETEVLEHRVVGGKSDRTVDVKTEGARLHTLELDAVIEFHDVYAIEHPEEIEVPPRPTELAIGSHLQASRPLRHQRGDRLVFDLTQPCVVEFARGMAHACLFDRGGAQKAADDIGAEWGVHRHASHDTSGCRFIGDSG